MKFKLQQFTDDDCGAVTVDWVVLTAAVVGLCLLMMNVIGQNAENSMTQMFTDVDVALEN